MNKLHSEVAAIDITCSKSASASQGKCVEGSEKESVNEKTLLTVIMLLSFVCYADQLAF